jgi:alkanesulfonate monooxygenase SsuD/methylene tetrahydromethanopterin reductase-like flavin-dependent oxidoreductase (luciferase family)
VPVTTCRPIRLNAFDMACVGHIQHGMWTHPRDHSSDYTSLDHWVRLARMLERGLFDGLFLADVLGAYDDYGGNECGRLAASWRADPAIGSDGVGARYGLRDHASRLRSDL